MEYRFRTVRKDFAEITEAAKRELARVWLIQQKNDGTEPTQQEIDDAIAAWETEETERLDLADLRDKITDEIEWLQTNRPLVTTATLDQLRAGIQRLMLQQEYELRAWRFVVRRLSQ